MIQTRTDPIIVQVTPGLFRQISHYGTPIAITHMEMLAQQASMDSIIDDFPVTFPLELGPIQFNATFTIGQDKPVLTLSQANLN